MKPDKSELIATSIEYLEEIYSDFRRDPRSVGADWAALFTAMERNQAVVPPSAIGEPSVLSGPPVVSGIPGRLERLAEIYRQRGHEAAACDPLELSPPDRAFLDEALRALTGSNVGVNRSIGESRTEGHSPTTEKSPTGGGFPTAKKSEEPGRIIAALERAYCGPLASEVGHIDSAAERARLAAWLEDPRLRVDPSRDESLRLFENIYRAEYFEKFLARIYPGKKRFSLEGGESLIALLDVLITEAAAGEVRQIVLGMAHRGRLNVLVNTMRKPARLLFAEFEERFDPEDLDYADVKYHLGYSNDIVVAGGREISLSLMFNPSHLEAVDPVVLGSVRARQTLNDNGHRRAVVPLLIHGDAAFTGQGIVFETLNMMNLEGYSVGGVVHVIVNNRIGFTAEPGETHSMVNASDVARSFRIPVLRVNGDDPEAVARAARIALLYRQQFGKSVIIDLLCYRRLGHNESDEPSFTQPELYKRIRGHPTTVAIYERRLRSRDEGIGAELEALKGKIRQELEQAHQKASEEGIRMRVDTMKGNWSIFSRLPLDSEPQTRLLKRQMERIFQVLTDIPEGFHPHPRLGRFLSHREKMVRGEEKIDWGFAEALAFGSILENGYGIRLAGQDSRRGTFSHRHAAYVDYETGEPYLPLQHISAGQGRLEIINSPLSEYAALGYEYGYSITDPRTLVIWEGQFGDFVNGAQIVIDQFIATSEFKWYRLNGLVLLLPHGYEGQGPEHSSARLERFLQLCAAENMQVCNCTTAAQYFHLLRRQILRLNRKPLVIMSPKSLLRYRGAASDLVDLEEGVFQNVLDDPGIEEERNVRRILLCSGKVFYDLVTSRDEREARDTAIIRFEQLYPFPAVDLKKVLKRYPRAEIFAWVQEEPQNMGAWNYIRAPMEERLRKKDRLRCITRTPAPSPAAGLAAIHRREQSDLVARALTAE